MAALLAASASAQKSESAQDAAASSLKTQNRTRAAPVVRGFVESSVTEGDAHLRDFHFQTGATMPDLRIHYRTLGAPRRDASGEVRNAVLILHGTGGAGTQFLRDIFAGELFEAGQPLDTAKYYVILPDGIGHGQSSKPSDGLRAKFPRYGYTDMVEAQYRMLSESLGVNHLRLILGTSMGCMHAYVWMERHPDFLDAAVPLACQPMQITGRNLLWRLTIIHAIRDDPAWKGGDYTENPPGTRTAAAILAFMGGNPLTWQKLSSTREKGIANFEKTTGGPLPDANDTAYAVDASWGYDPAPGLTKIRTPILHINFSDDTINPPELNITPNLLKQVPSAQFVLYPYTPETVGHGSHTKAALWKDKLAEFLRATEKQ
jgi:homoserine O-acetyltransferase